MTDDEIHYWFTCPTCRLMGSIDEDQAEGRISIQCITPDCDFHETGVVRPLIPTTTAISPQDAPSTFTEEKQ